MASSIASVSGLSQLLGIGQKKTGGGEEFKAAFDDVRQERTDTERRTSPNRARHRESEPAQSAPEPRPSTASNRQVPDPSSQAPARDQVDRTEAADRRTDEYRPDDAAAAVTAEPRSKSTTEPEAVQRQSPLSDQAPTEMPESLLMGLELLAKPARDAGVTFAAQVGTVLPTPSDDAAPVSLLKSPATAGLASVEQVRLTTQGTDPLTLPVGAMAALATPQAAAGQTKGMHSLNSADLSQTSVLTLAGDELAQAMDSGSLKTALAAEKPGAAPVAVNIQSVESGKTMLPMVNANLLAEAAALDKPKEGVSALVTTEPRSATPLSTGSAPGMRAPLAEGPAKSLPVTVPVSQPNWGQATGERILWMVSQKLQSAELQLDPPELGPLQVRISVQNDQVSLSFVSQHAQVREALDQQALRLREMFEGQGLDLVDVDVSDQSFQQQQEQAQQQGRAALDVDDAALDAPIVTPASVHLVDQFV